MPRWTNRCPQQVRLLMSDRDRILKGLKLADLGSALMQAR